LFIGNPLLSPYCKDAMLAVYLSGAAFVVAGAGGIHKRVFLAFASTKDLAKS
jgi:hypothetical protein